MRAFQGIVKPIGEGERIRYFRESQKRCPRHSAPRFEEIRARVTRSQEREA